MSTENETLPLEATEAGATADAPEVDVADSGTATTAATPTPPRTRWAAIIWGLFLGSLALTGLRLLAEQERLDAAYDWISNLTVGSITAVSLLAVGVLVLVAGAVGLIRRAQVRFARRRR